jgi:hypothetical protein
MRAHKTFAVALAAIAVAAAPASAAPEWQMGTAEQSTVANCNFDPEVGIEASAWFEADPQALPRVGDVFYARSISARVGNGCGSGMSVHVEFVLPVGVTTAISAARPVRCQLWDYTANTYTPLDGCPTAAAAGIYGPAFDRVASGSSQPWEVPYGLAVVIDVPLRSSRRLAGIAGGSPSCGRLDGAPPCSAEQSGDAVQAVSKVIDAGQSPWLSPYVGVFVEEGAATGGSAPSGSLIASSPRRATVKRVRRGMAVRVNVAAAGSRVVATLKLGRRTIARKRIASAATGTAKLRLKATKAGKRRLKRLDKRAKAKLVVRVTAPDGTRSVDRARVKVRP